MPVCMELKRIFKSEGKLVVSGAELRKLIGESSGRLDMSDGSQQDVMEFHDLLLKEIENEIVMIGDFAEREKCKEISEHRKGWMQAGSSHKNRRRKFQNDKVDSSWKPQRPLTEQHDPQPFFWKHQHIVNEV